MKITPFLPFRCGLLALAVSIATGLRPAAAATVYWDTNGSAIYSGSATPSGTWDASTANWTTDANGAIATSAYTAGSNVVFSAGTDATGAYTVTINGSQTVSGLNFEEGHVTIASMTVATDFLTLTGTVPVLNVQNMDSTISARINVAAGVTGYTKTGLGKLTLSYGANGTASYFSTGTQTLTINGGTVEINGTASADSLALGAVVINSGGTFRYAGPNSVSNNNVFTVNTGGTLFGGGDQIAGFTGAGLIQTNNNFNLTAGNTNLVFAGLITGTGAITYTGTGTTTQTLTGANTYTGTTGAQASTAATVSGGIRLGNVRAIQNSTLNLVNTNAAAINISFSSGIGTFIAGGLQGTSNLLLQDVGNSAVTLQVGNNDNSTATSYSGSLTGTGGLTKIGVGTIALAGTNTYTGDTTVNGGFHNPGSVSATNAGTLQLNFNATTAPAANIVNASSRLVLGGGRLLVSGKDNATTASQTFASMQVNAGRSYVVAAVGVGTSSAVVNLGNIARSAGGVVEFTLPTGTQNAANGITTTTGNTNGILGAWATFGNDWATGVSNGTTNNIAAYTGYTVLSGTTQTIASNAASNLQINDSGNLSTSLVNGKTTVNSAIVTVTSTAGLVVGQSITGTNIAAGAIVTAINANGTDFTMSLNATAAGTGLTFTAANPITLAASGVTDVNTIQSTSTGNRVIDLGGAGNTLRLGASGGIWGTVNTGGLLIQNGKLTAGGADNTPGDLLFNSTNGNGGIRVSATITDNGTAPVSVTKTGNGEVILSAANSYTGGTFATNGRLQASNLGALGTGTVTVTPGGQLWLSAGGVFNNNFVLSGQGYGETAAPGAIRLSNGTTMGNSTSTITLAGDTRIGTNSANGTIAGKLTGDYGVDFSAGGNASIFTLTNTGNDFAGNFSINSVIGTGAAITSYTGFNTTPVTVKLGASAGNGAVSTYLPNGAGKGNVVLSGVSGGAATLDLNSYNETINGLISQGTAANTFVTNNAATGTGTLTLGDNNTTASFSGIIKDGATAKVAVTKIGEGVQTFGGANTYSGPTTINKGILKAAAANTFSANSAIVIANDSTAILDLTDFSQTIGSLAGNGAVNLGTAAATPSAGAILTTGGDNSSTTYSGTIVGAGGLAKQGTGSFILAGANTYLGTTAVNAGTLQVGQSGAGQTGTGAVTVNGTGAVLAGTGTVQGVTTVGASGAGGVVRPGDLSGSAIGRLTFSDPSTSSLTLATGGVRAEFTLSGATGNSLSLGDDPANGIQTAGLLTGAPGAGTHDSINVLGTLNLISGGQIKLTLSGYTPQYGDVFNLFDWGAINAGTFNVASDLDFSAAPLSSGLAWDTSQFLTDGVIFVVPEPSTPLALTGGLAVLLMRRRRRAAKSLTRKSGTRLLPVS